ncbi:50S ribosomal protein L25/general stress protein Ctc [Cryobacterium breve]|jgi:large subunit ribosomal protein L25|uniref:Large ribosomal subunit protein bL25 n=1 Tax=Cryobacterium breve TaxID=1259258 RepID=A0ABY7NAY0_9MICO|nr:MULTISPECIES: 50S ribosomal protein L25/general stress protein Ctc [Cryobacterium]MDY7543016.1 50S ribosomal protein L25/general stress protein Ctc [Cryobacterium sp. 5B3]MEB0000379.1 50S ribosomal protein L25/general stress protein Ctc [Cryobacterium sp. RTS3]MEB0266093.1 50S ribosomal protein L25/general stress protein Ctc [Cryobacterium sp. 10I5]MEB0274041.1 50S ribosomal protein L25/general stress protein Ctc [Cryobacterium sp. 5B3]WBM79650.1 50S ribosomal protein L25/general stress pro
MAEAKDKKVIDNKIDADLRTKFGKGAARKLRVLGKIPAVIYGHGTDPVHVALPSHQIGLILRRANAVLELEVNGETHLTLVKDVQKDPVRQIIEHLDLIVIRKGEKVQVDVAVHLTGEIVAGNVIDLDIKSLLLEVEATNIPQNIVVNVDGLDEGAQIKAGEIVLPDGAVLISDADAVVISVHLPEAEEEEEAVADADAEAVVEEAPAE